MLKARVLTSIVLLPATLGLFLFAPKPLVLAFFAALMLLCQTEVNKLVGATFQHYCKESSPHLRPINQIYILTILGLTYLLFALKLTSYQLLFGLIPLGFIGAVIFAKSITEIISTISSLSLGLLYCVLPFYAVWEIYQESLNLLFMIMATTMLCDILAYFVGSKFGKHSLAPMLSPKKSWEGVIGGLIASVAGAWLLSQWLSLPLNQIQLCIFVLVTTISGIFGDLFESALKRFAHVKDSGNIIPGHGGVLDRLDAIMLAAPVAWFLIKVVF